MTGQTITAHPALRGAVAAVLTLFLTGCGTLPNHSDFFSRSDSAPRHNVDIHAIPDAEPRIEARSRYGNPDSYVIRGKRYHVRTNSTAFQQLGIASWYGTKFHGRRTSSGEPYDMFAMTAAHKTLPLPTWVEVFNHDNQQRIIVKVNDRGPFISGRIIDLSYAAATRLGVIATGTAKVTIKAIDPEQYLANKNSPAATNKDADSDVNTAATTLPPLATSTADHTPAKLNARTGLDLSRLPIARAAVTRPAATPRLAPVTALTTNQISSPETATSTPPTLNNGTFYLQVAAFRERNNAEQLRRRLLTLAAGKVQIKPNPHSQPTLYRVHIGPLTNLSQANRVAAQITAMGLGEPKIMRDEPTNIK